MADHSPNITISVSPGEVIDRLTIAEIKSERIADPAKLAHVRVELARLATAAKVAIADTDELRGLRAELKAVNEKLWVIEDDIRDCERQGDFGAAFVALARAVYRTNDQRVAVKRRINQALGSELIDEKSYAPY
ncbi:MAG: hypothetical protein E2O90_02790 [Alphaproteobacteria bacterium]|nr:hypothetical protein [Pseudomonadota bacterium]TDI67355.1 MAG: hypothetical protein E2O90_02790 [Alphaproteobacteria bacterium]